jgi:hypothetical protein
VTAHLKALITAILVAWVVLAGSAWAQNTVHYTATNANVKYLFATAEPVAHLKSGDILDTNTLDCFGNAIKKPSDTLSMVKGDNPLTGPFFVEGAEPGDTLAVKILELQVDGDAGVGAFAPGFGALNGVDGRAGGPALWGSQWGGQGPVWAHVVFVVADPEVGPAKKCGCWQVGNLPH